MATKTGFRPRRAVLMVCISSAGGNPVTDPLPQPVHDDTKPVILALNNAHAAELSWLEAAQLEALLQEAFYARQIGDGAAFLLAFDQAASYQSPNFRWFCQRYRRFVYIDRVVVAPLLRGRGYARTLYTDLFARAGRIGHTLGVCRSTAIRRTRHRMPFTRRWGSLKSVMPSSIMAARAFVILPARSEERRP